MRKTWCSVRHLDATIKAAIRVWNRVEEYTLSIPFRSNGRYYCHTRLSLTTHVLVGSYYQYHCRSHLSLDCHCLCCGLCLCCGAAVALAPIGVACAYVNDVLGWHRRRRIAVATIIAVRCITFTISNRRSRFQLTRQYRATIIGGHCCFPILLARYALWSVKPGSTGLELFSMPRQLSALSHITSSLARDSLRLAFFIILPM